MASGRLFKVYKERKQVATYLYNAQGQRTQKITKHGTTIYHYDLAGQLIAETSKAGDLIRAYVWLDDMPLAQIDVKGKEHDHRRKPRKERITYLHTDHLGTPRLATDTNQAIVWRWDSDAFGSEKPEHEDEETDDHKDITVNLRFAGQYFDKETKLHYNWNRYYDPKTGRYLSADSLGIEAGLNPFTYVDNNSLRWFDPTGQAKIGGGKIIPFPIPAPPTVPGAPSAPDATDTPGADEPSSRSRSREGARDRPKRCPDDLCDNVGQYLLKRYKPGDIEYDPARPGVALYRCDYLCRSSGATFTNYRSLREGYGGCPTPIPYSP